ncbi:Lsr2 dimerization domain-containing protein [Actinoallomurus acaciae]|uniref:Histone-like nucleoid-structuring protein Lsr2 n=1 Tax=Actinoallomurus acaciae TaxID=502577 RepID=A0ABV5YH47_9ACTN
MATKTIKIDDIDGRDGDDVAKRDFELGGMMFTIDLGDANFEKLQGLLDELAPFMQHAVKVKQTGRTRKNTPDGQAGA